MPRFFGKPTHYVDPYSFDPCPNRIDCGSTPVTGNGTNWDDYMAGYVRGVELENERLRESYADLQSQTIHLMKTVDRLGDRLMGIIEEMRSK